MNKLFRRARTPTLMMALAIIFLMPFLFAWWCHFYKVEWAAGLRNQGSLLQNSVVVPELAPSKKWRLVYVATHTCEQSCLHAIDTLAKVRLALGRHLYGIELCLVLLQSDAAEVRRISHQFKEWDIQVQLLSHIPDELQKASVWILDDQNRGVLTYLDESDPRAIFVDLKQLTRLWNMTPHVIPNAARDLPS